MARWCTQGQEGSGKAYDSICNLGYPGVVYMEGGTGVPNPWAMDGVHNPWAMSDVQCYQSPMRNRCGKSVKKVTRKLSWFPKSVDHSRPVSRLF